MNFKEEVLKLGIELKDGQLDQFEQYYRFLIEENRKMNLTAITEQEEVYRKHFLDSLEISRILPVGSPITLLDVGSGAGFPSVPYAIVSPDTKVTIIDALQKRIRFLEQLTNKLRLTNVEVYHFRAEDYAKEKREFFSVVTARAVARLNVLCELCLPLVALNGIFIAMKGASAQEEVREAEKSMEALGGKLEKQLSIELPEQHEKREIIVIRKVRKTPACYPRRFAMIKERPIV